MRIVSVLPPTRVLHLFSNQILQPRIAARFGDLQEVDLAELIKIQKLIIDVNFPAPIALGQNSDDMGIDRIGFQIF